MTDRNPMDIRMDAATDEAHTAIVNYEPTYLALGQAVTRYCETDDGIAEICNELVRDIVETLASGTTDFDGIDWAEVDFAAMIQWEAELDDNDRIGGPIPNYPGDGKGDGKSEAATGISKLDLDTVDLMIREANRGLMVAFINHDLLKRAALDVRHSVVLYDDRHMFQYAMAEMPDEDTQRKLLEHTTVRFWAIGV